MLPCVQSYKPPVLSEESYADIIENNRKAMKSARIAHVQVESSERIRRALSHNMKLGDVKYINGDLVCFQRKNDKRWHGPGTVIGQCGQLILIRHQSSWVRVNPGKMQLIEREEKGFEMRVEGNNQKMFIGNEMSDINHDEEHQHTDNEDCVHLPTTSENGIYSNDYKEDSTEDECEGEHCDDQTEETEVDINGNPTVKSVVQFNQEKGKFAESVVFCNQFIDKARLVARRFENSYELRKGSYKSAISGCLLVIACSTWGLKRKKQKFKRKKQKV